MNSADEESKERRPFREGEPRASFRACSAWRIPIRPGTVGKTPSDWQDGIGLDLYRHERQPVSFVKTARRPSLSAAEPKTRGFFRARQAEFKRDFVSGESEQSNTISYCEIILLEFFGVILGWMRNFVWGFSFFSV